MQENNFVMPGVVVGAFFLECSAQSHQLVGSPSNDFVRFEQLIIPIAFCTVDHLIPLLKNICAHPKAVQDVTLSWIKCAQIVKYVIAQREVKKIVQNLQHLNF